MNGTTGVFAREVPALGSYVQVGLAQGRVVSVGFPDRPQEDVRPDHEVLDRVEGYLDGDADGFRDVTLALTLPTHRRRVLEALREVPYGEGVTVGQLARMTAGLDDESETDLGTVREALTANPMPILIADHRVRDAPGSTPTDIAELCRRVEGI